MSSKKYLSDTKLFYHTTVFAIASLRITKLTHPSFYGSLRELYEYIHHDAYDSAFINIAKIFDTAGTSNNVEKILKATQITNGDKNKITQQWELIKKEHNTTIKRVINVRNEIVAHFDKTLDISEPQPKYILEITEIDALLQEVKLYIESLPWFSEENMEPLQYTDILRDFRQPER